MSVEPIIDERNRWLGLSASERAALGPGVIGTCAGALAELVERLARRGYPAEAMVTPCPDPDEAAAELAEAGIAVPPALVEVWRRIGGICLVDLGRYRHMGFWEDLVGGDARVFACDGVVIDGPDDGWVGYVLDVVDEQAETGEALGVPIAPDALHKDDTSGGPGYELVPDERDPWMASLRHFDWGGPARPSSAPEGSSPDLVSYLRTAILECGGFPGLFGSPGFEPVRLELTEGLPIF